jgi:hypothetical protein
MTKKSLNPSVLIMAFTDAVVSTVLSFSKFKFVTVIDFEPLKNNVGVT